MEDMLDKMIRDEWGGAHPVKDNPVRIKVRVKDRVIEAFVVGKWRGVGYYQGKKVPSKKHMDEALRRLRMNSGYELKEVEWVWEEKTS